MFLAVSIQLVKIAGTSDRGYADRFFLPLARRRRITFLPAAVAILAKNPTFLFFFNVFG
jgi:hypothetical protein